MAIGVLVLALAILARAIAVARTRWRIRALVGRLATAPAPGTLAAELARATGDPLIRVAYRLPEDDLEVDAEGRPLPPPPSGLEALPVGPDAAATAVVRHRPGLDADALRTALTPSLLIALDNERLRAARLARMRELQASRARIVAVADAERRRLERDLHDGAQQRLLAVAFDLRVRRTKADAAGRSALAGLLARAEATALAGIEAIRRLARGVYPVVLAQAGLGAALRSLAEDAPIPIELEADLAAPLPQATELAAYHVVVDALGVATDAGANQLIVRASVAGDLLALSLEDDASSPAARYVRVADRVGAAGGRLDIRTVPAGGTRLEVELPCA
jgi:signal transduction histidine kinase